MQIVIEIPEEYYKAIMEIPVIQSTVDMLIIKNGTPLPKGHGRLIDADDVLNLSKHPKRMYDWDIQAILKSTSTIIEADKCRKEQT